MTSTRISQTKVLLLSSLLTACAASPRPASQAAGPTSSPTASASASAPLASSRPSARPGPVAPGPSPTPAQALPTPVAPSPASPVPGPAAPVPSPSGWWRPAVDASWQIQLSEEPKTSYDVAVYDLDLYDTPEASLRSLQASGRRVVCYFSAGSYEDWRSDKDRFQASDLGKPLDGWPGERWLDVRSENVRAIMRARLDLAKSKGCDGVDPDNVDGYANDTGLPLSGADQLDYNRFLAREAHQRGLAVGLKNDLDQIPELVSDFDFSVNEQCHEYEECHTLTPFVAAGKPVFNIEYDEELVSSSKARAALCDDSAELGLQTLILPLELDGSFRHAC